MQKIRIYDALGVSRDKEAEGFLIIPLGDSAKGTEEDLIAVGAIGPMSACDGLYVLASFGVQLAAAFDLGINGYRWRALISAIYGLKEDVRWPDVDQMLAQDAAMSLIHEDGQDER